MSKERRIVALVLVAMAALAALVIFNAWPGDQKAQGVVDAAPAEDAPIHATVVLESIDPSRGTVHLTLNVMATGEGLGPEGATLLTDIPGLAPVALPRDLFASPIGATAVVDSGDVSEYPYDRYPLTIAMTAIQNDSAATATAGIGDVPVPMTLAVTSALNGFEAKAGSITVEDGVATVELILERQDAAISWAVAMMVIYWLLATSAMAVAVAILTGIRPFETRHLAWLTAFIFAFAAFRNTAPGSPPIGVFLDFAAFFWAIGIVVLAELLILGYYLFSKQDDPA